jgi:hypothetical protein
MSLSHSTEVNARQMEVADRNHGGYGFVPALVCVALALMLASEISAPVSIDSGISNETSPVGP